MRLSTKGYLKAKNIQNQSNLDMARLLLPMRYASSTG